MLLRVGVMVNGEPRTYLHDLPPMPPMPMLPPMLPLPTAPLSNSVTVPVWWLQKEVERQMKLLRPGAPPPYSEEAAPPPKKQAKCVHHEWLQDALAQAATATAKLVGAAAAASTAGVREPEKVKEAAAKEVPADQVGGDLVIDNQALRLKIIRLKCPDCKGFEIHSCKKC